MTFIGRSLRVIGVYRATLGFADGSQCATVGVALVCNEKGVIFINYDPARADQRWRVCLRYERLQIDPVGSITKNLAREIDISALVCNDQSLVYVEYEARWVKQAIDPWIWRFLATGGLLNKSPQGFAAYGIKSLDGVVVISNVERIGSRFWRSCCYRRSGQ